MHNGEGSTVEQHLQENYRLLRVSVEALVAAPGLIVVSSALSGDGKTEVACGLARALAECGHKTALIDTNWQHPSVAASLGIDEIAPVMQLDRIADSGRNGAVKNLEAISVADQRFPALISTPVMQALIADLHSRYHYTIIDSASINVGMAGLQFARFADGVLLAVRLGRAPKPADKMAIGTLERVGARVLGIVATGAQEHTPKSTSMAAFEQEPARVAVGVGV
ncbi:tyrosine-protein kinase family protein [bacterium]|nr:MAG: tyrosine-protein kinase family protein [bacterium]